MTLQTTRARWSFILFIIVTGCGKQEKTLPVRPLYLNFTQEPSTTDPRKVSDFSSSSFAYFLYEGLTRSTPNSTHDMGIADHVEIENGGLTYKFFLKNASWSDGTRVTAYDFERTWKEVLDPAFPAPNAHLFYPIKGAEMAKSGKLPLSQVGIKALNNQVLLVELESPTPYFLELVGFCSFFPYKEGKDNKLIVNGPYTIESWKPQDKILITKNPSYWDFDGIKLNKIQFSLVSDEMTALQLYERDEIDMMGSPFTTLPTDAIPYLKQEGSLKTYDMGATTLLAFNVQHPFFSNVKVRRAFALAIDRKEIVENLTMLGETIANDFVPPLLKDYQKDILVPNCDKEEALTLFNEALAEMNLTPKDLHLHLLHSPIGLYPKIAQVIQEQWRQLFKINIQIEQTEHKVYMNRIAKNDFDMAIFCYIAQYMDPMNILERFKLKSNKKNISGWEDAEYKALIDEATKTSDKELQKELFFHLEAILAREVPITPLYHWKSGFIAKNTIKNIKQFPQGSICFHEIEIEA